MSAYYNENNKYAAQWLRNLIDNKQIEAGIVDDRSIEEVTPNDLQGFKQCHFFAGIGVWSYALRLAKWPKDREVWTGSCPCQPFANPGKKAGFTDERHLWPFWLHLINVRRPRTIFGEQVSSKGGLSWLDLVQTDLEGNSYSFGAMDLSAAGVGAPHKRQRLYFAADSNYQRNSGHSTSTSFSQERPWGSFSPMDLQQITSSPFVQGSCFPQPLLRKMDDGFTNRVGRISAYGNAIVAPLAQKFIESYMEIIQ
jgi:DNA (cytosine-5)-methyltransferase 1